jgi:uncharacterized protein (DUF111 family)
MELRPESTPASLLILAQVDHACGDVISTVMEQFSTAGARNVHLVPSLTKKGRPGYLLYIDVPEDCLEAVERLLSVELGVLGWRILAAEHRGPAARPCTVNVTLTSGGVERPLAVPAKIVRDPATGDAVAHIEHDFCVRLQRELRESGGVDMPLSMLKARIRVAVADAVDEARCGDVDGGKETQA